MKPDGHVTGLLEVCQLPVTTYFVFPTDLLSRRLTLMALGAFSGTKNP